MYHPSPRLIATAHVSPQCLFSSTPAITAIETAPAPPPMQIKSMPVKEQRSLMKLIEKYAEDHEAMERDISLNVNQQTASQIKKRIELLQRLQSL
jgi:hypothetical protein